MRSALEGVAGVHKVTIDNSAKTATVMFDGEALTPDDLVAVFANHPKFKAAVQS